MAVDTRDAEDGQLPPASGPTAVSAEEAPDLPGPEAAGTPRSGVRPVGARADGPERGDVDDIEELDDIEEIDEIEEIDDGPAPLPAPPGRPRAGTRPTIPPPVPPRPATSPPVPPRPATSPPVPPSAMSLSAVPRRMSGAESGSMGIAAESGRIDLLADHSGPIRLPGSGPVAAEAVVQPAGLEIAAPSVLDQAVEDLEGDPGDPADRRHGASMAWWQARARALAARLQVAPDAPTAAALAHELGELRERVLGDEDGALAAHGQALDADPSLRASAWALYRLLHRRGQWDELARLLDGAALAAAEDQERAQLYIEKAHILDTRLHDLDGAREAYEQAAAFHPPAIPAHQGMERLAVAAGDLDLLARALAALAECMDAPAHRLVYLLDLARLAVDAGDLGGAREALERAAALGVDRARVAREQLRLAELSDDAEEMIAALEAQVAAAASSGAPASPEGDTGDAEDTAAALVALRRMQAQVARDRLDDPERAWSFLQDALARAPGEPLVLADLTDLAERLGRYDELAMLFQGLEALGGEGASPALTLRRADALLRSGRRDEARVLLEALARELPGALPVLALRERDALQAGDWAALARAYRDAAAHAERWFGDTEGATEAATEAAEDAADPDAAAALAVCAGHVLAWLCGDQDGAEAALAEALARAPGHGPAIEALVALHERRGRLDRAAALLEEHAATGSAQERVHRLERLARLYQDLDQPEQVLDVERRLLALAPAGPARARLLWRIEATLAVLGRARERAETLVELAVALDAPASRAAALLAAARAFEVLAEAGAASSPDERTETEPDEDGDEPRAHAARAAALYRQVLEIWPEDRYARSALVALLRRSGDWEELVAARRAEAAELPDGPAVVRALREAAAILRDELGRPDEAADVLRELLDRVPGHAGAMHELAEALIDSGDIDELVDTLELESVTADAPRAQVLATLRLGAALERAGRRDQAAGAYRRILDLAPDEAAAQALELGLAPALAAAAVVELADPEAEAGARIDALERLAESAADPVLAGELLEDAGWRWLVDAEAMERAQDAFERASRLRRAGGEPASPGALLGLAMLQARHGDAGAAGQTMERLAATVDAPAVRAALLLRAAALAEAGGDRAGAVRRAGAAVAAAPEDASTLVTAAEYAAGVSHDQPAPGADPVDAPGAEPSEDAAGDSAGSPGARAELFAMRAALSGDGNEWELERAESLEVAGHLGEAARIAGAVLAESPDELRAVELLRRVCRRAGDRAGLARADLALARVLPSAESRLVLLREAAAVLDRELGDAALALWTYRRILAEEPGAPEHERAVAMCREHGDVRAEAELLTARLSWLSLLTDVDPEAAHGQVPLLLDRARLRRSVGDVAGADRDLALLLAIDGHHTEGLALRAQVAEELGSAEQAAEHWRRYLAVETDADRRAAAERSLARLLVERLDDVEGALAQLEQVVRHAPDDLAVRERLVALLLRTESWPRAVREIGEIERRRESPAERARDQMRMAAILRDHIGDRRGAVAAAEAARSLDPESLEAIGALADLVAESPARRHKVLRQGARDLRAAIAARPGDAALYARLAEVAGWQGDGEARFYAACALSFLGALPEGQREVLAATGASLADAPLPSGTLAPDELSKHLSAVRADGAHLAADVWALIGEAVTRSLGHEPAALGFGRGDRHKHLDSPYQLAARAATALALESAEHYVSEGRPGYARALQLDRPVLCLGADVARGDSPAARMALGRCVADARMGTGAVAVLDEPTLYQIFAAAAQVAGAPAPGSVAGAAMDQAAVEARARDLSKHMSRRDRRQLARLADRMGEVDAPAWRRAVLRTRMRAGVLLAADLRGLGALLGPGARPDDPDVLELLAWMAGEDHLWLRRHLGMSRGKPPAR